MVRDESSIIQYTPLMMTHTQSIYIRVSHAKYYYTVLCHVFSKYCVCYLWYNEH